MKKARIYSYSIVQVAATQFKSEVPYVVAILEDEDGQRFPARLLGYCESREVCIGDEVEFAREDGLGHVLYML